MFSNIERFFSDLTPPRGTFKRLCESDNPPKDDIWYNRNRLIYRPEILGRVNEAVVWTRENGSWPGTVEQLGSWDS